MENTKFLHIRKIGNINEILCTLEGFKFRLMLNNLKRADVKECRIPGYQTCPLCLELVPE